MKADAKLNDAFRVSRHLEDEISECLPKTSVMIRCEPSDFEDVKGDLGDFYKIGKEIDGDTDPHDDR